MAFGARRLRLSGLVFQRVLLAIDRDLITLDVGGAQILDVSPVFLRVEVKVLDLLHAERHALERVCGSLLKLRTIVPGPVTRRTGVLVDGQNSDLPRINVARSGVGRRQSREAQEANRERGKDG